MIEPQDKIVPLLREMRAGFERVDRKLERGFDNRREAVKGEPVLGRSAAAKVEERLEAIGKRLAALEKAV